MIGGKRLWKRIWGHADVRMPCSWWRGHIRALSPVESILNFIWILRSTRICTLPFSWHRHSCLLLLLCYNLSSVLHRYKYLRYGAKLMPVSSRSCVFPPLSDTTPAEPSSASNNPVNGVCVLAEILRLFSPVLGICARSRFFLRVRIQNIASIQSSFLAIKLWDSKQVAFCLIFLLLVENGDFTINFLWFGGVINR